jgi:aspartate/methionine/tyrosine aminotransferase
VFARRAAWDLTPNPLSERVAARRKLGLPVLDLSDTNPTHAGLAAPAEALALALGELARDAAALRYDADPRGEPAVRAAVAACHPRAAPDDVVLTAGTSEGYAHLFRMLADAGDLVHVPTPGYPLFEHLAELEGVEVARYPLRPPPPAAGARWRIDLPALVATLSPRSRAVLLIHPHSPTGSFVDRNDLAALRALGRERGFALISDEVFAASAPEGGEPGALVGAEQGPLHFVLSGASKLLALPQLKVAWIAVGGPARERAEAVARLEFVADAYLSVSPLLASLLPRLLAQRDGVRRELLERVSGNRAKLLAALAACPGVECLPAEAGWSAIVRVERGDGIAPDEEALALALLDRAGILVQPGFVFDLEGEAGRPAAHLVLCLLAEPESFAEGARGLARARGEGRPREC